MEHLTEEALRVAILTEKRSHDFYHHAAELVENDRLKQMFRNLAGEEASHMERFHSLYKKGDLGNLESLMQPAPLQDEPSYRTLVAEVDARMREQQALLISLREEQTCIEHYTMLARSFREPRIHEIFDRALKESYNHYEIILDEFMHLMGMVEWVDQGE